MVINSTRTWRVRHCQTVFKTKAYPYIHTHIHLYINLSLYTSIHIYIHTHIHHTHTSIHTLSGCQVSNLPQRSGASGWTDWTVFFLVLYYMICIFDGDGRRLCVIKMTPMDGCGRHINFCFSRYSFCFFRLMLFVLGRATTTTNA